MINPLIPMGAITRSMTRAEVRRMMEAYAEAGLEQYLFYARGGCSIPYMSEEWLDLCENIVREAERLGMKVWLYDEYDCPSGTCARTITRDFPEFSCQGIRNGETVHDWAYINMADLLNPACVREFMNRTYEKLYARLRPWFGTTVIGIFSDEPSMGCALKGTVDTHAYTPGIEAEYEEAYGEDLFEGLRRRDPQTLENYYALLGRRFTRTFTEPLRHWCEARGVLFTGHLLEESNMRNAVNTSGHLLRQLKAFSLPGIDEIFNYIGTEETEWLTFGSAYAARGSRGVLAELGALGPCDNPPGRDLQMLRLAALFGIDHYVLAVAGADCAGSTVKTDWLHPTNYTQPWFACFREYGRLATEAAELAQKTIAAEVAVVYPAREAARDMEQPESHVDRKLLPLLRQLTRAQIQWILTDEDEAGPQGVPRITWDTAPEEVLSRIIPAARVTDAGGMPAKEVLVRRYTDGTVCVLDLQDQASPRILRLDFEGQQSVFTLYPRDLFINTAPAREYEEVRVLPPPPAPVPDRPILTRCIFTGSKPAYSFELAAPKTFSFRIRSHQMTAEVLLDGQKIVAEQPCTDLPRGLRELYGQTAPIPLSRGRHTVSLSEAPGRSEYYLPSVFIEGLSSDPEDFAGKLTYDFEADLPASAQLFCLGFEAHELPLKLYVNGEELGTRIASPFVFSLPERLNGSRIHVTLEQFTTVGPLFGKAEAVLPPDMPPDRVLKRYFPGKYRGTGIESIRLLQKKL